MTIFTMTAGNLPSRLALAAFGLILIAAAAGTASTANATQFGASRIEVRQMCTRFDAEFYAHGRRYGCGELIKCIGGQCRSINTWLLGRELNGHDGGGNGNGNGVR